MAFIVPRSALASPPTGGLLVCVTDSLTAGYELGPGEDYPAQLAVSLGGSWTVVNQGVVGRSSTVMLANIADVTALYSAANPWNGVVALFGTNDIASGASASTVLNNGAAYYAGLKSGGPFAVYSVTIPACGFFDGGMEAIRLSVNTSLRNGAGTYGDYVVDLAADPRFQNTFDTTYYQADRIHFTPTGNGVEAALVKARVLA
jgi:lysophospholipase L1-like esterase